jgi:hypothetical protein
LLGNDFLGLGTTTSQPTQLLNNPYQQPQNTGFNFNQGGFGWGNNATQATQPQNNFNQPVVNQPPVQQNPNKFLAF